jgi:hypothetical protein
MIMEKRSDAAYACGVPEISVCGSGRTMIARILTNSE